MGGAMWSSIIKKGMHSSGQGSCSAVKRIRQRWAFVEHHISSGRRLLLVPVGILTLYTISFFFVGLGWEVDGPRASSLLDAWRTAAALVAPFPTICTSSGQYRLGPLDWDCCACTHVGRY